jgi:AcrR family transcriptional regulator
MSEPDHPALDQFAREDLVEQGSWRQRRSVETRKLLLEAAIDSLNRYGYASTTTQLIIEIAQVSRGAMLHHYATRMDLIAALIDYLLHRRAQMFKAAESLSEADRRLGIVGVEVLWGNMLSREYEAYFELCAAARTDPDLMAILLPKTQQFEAVVRAESLRVFPEWQGKEHLLDLARDINRATLEGLRFNASLWPNHERRATAVRAVLRKLLAQIRDGQFDTLVAAPQANPQAESDIR